MRQTILVLAGLVMTLGMLLAAAPSQATEWSDAIVVAAFKEGPRKPQVYAVQVGRFRELGKAESLVATLQSQGHQAYLFQDNTSHGGAWHAVRLGLFNSLDKALAAARRFQEATGSPASISAEGTTYPVPLDTAVFLLQVGAFSVPQNAADTAAELKALGYSPRRIVLHDRAGKPWDVLYTATFNSQREAEAAAKAFHAKEKLPCYVDLVDREQLKGGGEDHSEGTVSKVP